MGKTAWLLCLLACLGAAVSAPPTPTCDSPSHSFGATPTTEPTPSGTLTATYSPTETGSESPSFVPAPSASFEPPTGPTGSASSSPSASSEPEPSVVPTDSGSFSPTTSSEPEPSVVPTDSGSFSPSASPETPTAGPSATCTPGLTNICFAVDSSDSVEGEPYENAKAFVISVLSGLEEEYSESARYALVQFTDLADVVSELSGNGTRALTRASSLEFKGGEQSIDRALTACGQVLSEAGSLSTKILVLVTAGGGDIDQELGNMLKASEITIMTIGAGGALEEGLEELASEDDQGSPYYYSSSDSADTDELIGDIGDLLCTEEPTVTPTASVTPSESPSMSPTFSPTETPTFSPTDSGFPTATPSVSPTFSPTESPTFSPTDSGFPTATPTESPTFSPTDSGFPTATPSVSPTFSPTESPTFSPTDSGFPTATPSVSPTFLPTFTSSESPTFSPIDPSFPSITPSVSPTFTPSESPTPSPTDSGSPSTTPTATSVPTPSGSPDVTPSPTLPATPSPSDGCDACSYLRKGKCVSICGRGKSCAVVNKRAYCVRCSFFRRRNRLGPFTCCEPAPDGCVPAKRNGRKLYCPNKAKYFVPWRRGKYYRPFTLKRSKPNANVCKSMFNFKKNRKACRVKDWKDRKVCLFYGRRNRFKRRKLCFFGC